MTLQNKTVVVIGGSSGIGQAVAQGALKLGARVIVGARRVAAEASPGSLQGWPLDIGNEAQLHRFFERVGPFDHLVVTAGAPGGSAPVRALTTEALQQALTVKLVGSLLAVKHAALQLRPGGSIGLTSGMLARKPSANAVIKTAINGAIEASVRQLAKELAPLRVYGVSPGPVETPSWDHLDEPRRRALFEQLGASLPVGFTASADDTAAAYLFAMRARALTGTVIDLDSGALLG